MPRNWDERDPPNPRHERILGVIAWIVIALILIGTAQLAWARKSGEVPIVPAGQTFTCTPIAVWDGDGPIWCAEGPRVRLANIAARELDNTCRRGHPCPSASGIAARDYLVILLGGSRGRSAIGHVLVRGPILHCKSAGGGKGSRTAAACAAGGVDLQKAMVASGMAEAWRQKRRTSHGRGRT